MKQCYLFGAGMSPGGLPLIEDGGFIVAVDGGYRYLKNAGIKPHVLIGDFDSLDRAELPSDVKRIELNPVKDITDMAAAIELGIDHGCVEFHLYGAAGGRNGHLIANIALLTGLAKRKLKGYVYSDNEVMTVICNETISFSAWERGYISVFSLSEKSTGVCERGLKYELCDYTMTYDNPIGVSNEFIGTESEISVKDGTLLLIKENQS